MRYVVPQYSHNRNHPFTHSALNLPDSLAPVNFKVTWLTMREVQHDISCCTSWQLFFSFQAFQFWYHMVWYPGGTWWFCLYLQDECSTALQKRHPPTKGDHSVTTCRPQAAESTTPLHYSSQMTATQIVCIWNTHFCSSIVIMGCEESGFPYDGSVVVVVVDPKAHWEQNPRPPSL
jgi:hypothetical protein